MLAEKRPATALERNASLDNARARELYKYFRPPAADGGLPDTVLTAHAQLVAWRLNAERSMITLIDEETQYFVAESTKTLHLDNTSKFDHPDDALWAGCVRVPMAGRLCEHTLATLPPPDGGPACFEVLDLSKDERFNQLEFVKGKPHFRNYVGVPLRTRKGINIGSLFIIDSNIRPALNGDERQFLGTMATNIIQHLEMNKEKKDHQRTTNMHRYLSTYVDPELQRKRCTKPHSRTVGVRASSAALRSDYNDKATRGSERHEIFSPAAELLKEALDLEEGGGGVVFLDTVASFERPQLASLDTDKSETSSGPDSDREEMMRPFQPPPPDVHPLPFNTHSPTRASRASNMSTEVLAHAHYPVPKSHTSRLNTRHFTPLSPEALSKLIKRHPRGKLFTFDKEGHTISSSEDDQAKSTPPHGEKGDPVAKGHNEAKTLRTHFSMARQIIFLPLWDPTTSRSFACFIYNCSDYRDFSRNSELLYCITFTNCIMTEIARLATLKADQQKSDFIGSISHELRSPLHGILASCEFLEETECSTFQRSLVDTADSCARTLLDTINMVLDYSNINTLEKKHKRSKRSRDGIPRKHSPSCSLQSNLSVYQYVDVASMTEEVVDGVATGHVFTNRPHKPDTDIAQAHDGKNHDKDASLSPSTSYNRDVELIIDIPSQNWTYWTQPGALKRIIVNLVNNSLKYTKHGFVHVKLEALEDDSSPDPQHCSYVTLTVTDSGQGISAAYMKDKLFTPFAQESSLTPGTGLGLSLVKSIVGMLNGKIGIESDVGVGTKVTVEIPVTRGNPASNGQSDPTSFVGSVVERIREDSLELVKKQARDRSIAIYSNDRQGTTKAQHRASLLMRESLENYLGGWCGFTVRSWISDAIFDIVISERSDLNDLLLVAPHLFTNTSRTMVLVLCDTATARDLDHAHINSNVLQQIRYPVGPYKFARALRTCFEHLEQSEMTRQGVANIVMGDHTEAKVLTPAEAITAALGNTVTSPAIEESPYSAVVETHNSVMHDDHIRGQIVTNNVDILQASDAIVHTKMITESILPDNDDDSSGGIPHAAEEATHGPTQAQTAARNPTSITPRRTTIHTITTTDNHLQTFTTPNVPATPSLRLPRMLLVDDNSINLRLLQVFMKKRKYTSVLTALDGQQAVNTYREALYATPSVPPDVVLMDISMPVLDGFEATRQIRGLEEEWNAKSLSNGTDTAQGARQNGAGYVGEKGRGGEEKIKEVHALIIALTGLASVRDQKEAFTSGADMYMMKPASFARLSGIMDGWEREGGSAGFVKGVVERGEEGGGGNKSR
ncbi:hypothetical protein T440DRAFT_510054 [Plenodomus tracheiphilus IPT5]|uniref:histidine kinase n=1 Tax=Plenodomus tracheiphilus IPT5 TaxID=1408161 RepID=A0A6A7AYX9_9PLEO|nr:hypothetical protein T440DRAFT_510054 [Plenodomus tracheiphilus IPT5]